MWFRLVWTGILRFSPVFLGLAIIGNRLRLRSVQIRQKNWTEPDLRTLGPDEDPECTGSRTSAPRTSTEPISEVYQNVLVSCNTLVKGYRKGEISKASVYSEIQTRLAEALKNEATT